MKTSTILTALSSLLKHSSSSSSSSSVVVPLPSTSSSLDQQQLLHTLLQCNDNWLLQALDASITTQQNTLKSLSSVTFDHPSDSETIQDYLDFNANLLDACNELCDKLGSIQRYVESLKIVSHLLGLNVEPHPTTLAKVLDLLDSFDHDRLMNQSSRFKRSFKHHSFSSTDSRLDEILKGSKVLTSMMCDIVGMALSLKSIKGGFAVLRRASSMGSFQLLGKHVKENLKSGSSIMLIELHRTVEAARNLRAGLKSRERLCDRGDVEELKRRCEELEERIIPFEGKVKELYKHLISVRMALLGALSNL